VNSNSNNNNNNNLAYNHCIVKTVYSFVCLFLFINFFNCEKVNRFSRDVSMCGHIGKMLNHLYGFLI
jgi:hypothetical protein